MKLLHKNVWFVEKDIWFIENQKMLINVLKKKIVNTNLTMELAHKIVVNLTMHLKL
jgi:hypothetical protein